MGQADLFDLLPLWLVFASIVVIVLLCVYGGFVFGRWRAKGLPREAGAPVSTIVGAIIGLLAFILAFTFGLTASRFDTRKELLLDEINAIETTFLRTDLIPEPHRSAVRGLLREYVDIRVELFRHPENLAQAVRESQRLQGLMWPHAAALAEADLRNPDIVSLFVNSLNEMFDMQTKRVTVGAFYRIPWVIRVALFGLTILTMLGVGYLLGISGHANWLLVAVFALAFAGVITLIADLDRGGAGRPGFIKITPQPMIDLQQRIRAQMEQGGAAASAAVRHPSLLPHPRDRAAFSGGVHRCKFSGIHRLACSFFCGWQPQVRGTWGWLPMMGRLTSLVWTAKPAIPRLRLRLPHLDRGSLMRRADSPRIMALDRKDARRFIGLPAEAVAWALG